MLSTGALIWVSVRPLVRLSLCTACGFIITKADIFPAVAARGTGQIMLNITLPALMFSRIVPSFTSDNVSALGPLVFVALLYEALGILIAWLVKQFFWVPHRFRYGILVAGGWSNVGDVPTAVIMSITGSAPFNGSTDQTLAVAYIAAFILVFVITLFPMGGARLLEWDYAGPDVDDEDLRKSVPAKTRESLGRITRGLSVVRRRFTGSERMKDEGEPDLEHSPRSEKFENGEEDSTEKGDGVEARVGTEGGDGVVSDAGFEKRQSDIAYASPLPAPTPQLARCQRTKHVSFLAEAEVDDGATAVPTERVCSPPYAAGASTTAGGTGGGGGAPSGVTSPAPSITIVDPEFNPADPSHRHRFTRRQNNNPCNATPITSADALPPASTDKCPAQTLPESVGPSTTTRPRSRARRHILLAHARTVLMSMLTTQTIAILLALIISLVPPLKALFTPVYKDGDGETLVPNAPDGQPPLAFLLDTTSFIGAASVPMGLVCLGSALARLQVPRSPAQWRSLPLGAICSLAVGKMIVMPIIGLLVVGGLTNVGMIDREDVVLRFVCIFLSCIPTATTQVFLTQIYSGTGEASTLSAFLIPQYALMFITMTALLAYTLSLLF